jgi:WhiB family redox-sensing transcriptional regulator
MEGYSEGIIDGIAEARRKALDELVRAGMADSALNTVLDVSEIDLKTPTAPEEDVVPSLDSPIIDTTQTAPQSRARTESSDWQSQAACKGNNKNHFPPDHFESKKIRKAREARAKAICSVCPVQVQCLEYSLVNREPAGIWGGVNEIERNQMLIQREQRGLRGRSRTLRVS